MTREIDKIAPWLQVVKKIIMEIERRQFLKYGVPAVIGTVTGVTVFPVRVEISEAVSDFTGKQEGNAWLSDLREQACKDAVQINNGVYRIINTQQKRKLQP